MPRVPNLFRGNIIIYLVGVALRIGEVDFARIRHYSLSLFPTLLIPDPLLQRALLMKYPVSAGWWCFCSWKLTHDVTERHNFFFHLPLHHVFFMFTNVTCQFPRCLWPSSYNCYWIGEGANHSFDKNWVCVMINYDVIYTLGTAWVRGSHGNKACSSHTLCGQFAKVQRLSPLASRCVSGEAWEAKWQREGLAWEGERHEAWEDDAAACIGWP